MPTDKMTSAISTSTSVNPWTRFELENVFLFDRICLDPDINKVNLTPDLGASALCSDLGHFAQDSGAPDRRSHNDSGRRHTAGGDDIAPAVTDHCGLQRRLTTDIAAAKTRRRKAEIESTGIGRDVDVRVNGRVCTENSFSASGAGDIAIEIDKNDPAVIEARAIAKCCAQSIGACTYSDGRFRSGSLRACEIEARVQVVGSACDTAIRRKVPETRYADGQDNPDHKHRDEKLVERETVLVFTGHAANIRMIFKHFISIRRAAKSARQAVEKGIRDLT